MRAGALQVSGGVLETGWWGPEPSDAPTLVLLHEGLGSVALWRDVPERLAAATGWGVFAYSRFGYGSSDTAALPRPMTYLHDEALVVLPAVLQAAGIRRAVLVGHSDGGSIAAIYSGAKSGAATESVAGGAGRRIDVIADTGPPSPRVLKPAAQGVDKGPSPAMAKITPCAPDADRSADAMTPRVQLLGIVTIAAHFVVEALNIASILHIKDEYETGALRQRLSRYHSDVDTAFRGWNDAWLDPRFQDFDITDFLPFIAVPLLALQGADDPYGTDIQLRVLEAHVTAPIHTRLIAAARHSPHLEATDETLAAITSFIANLPRGSST